jgi:hypothetical protein
METPLHFYRVTLEGVLGVVVGLGQFVYFLPDDTTWVQRVDDFRQLTLIEEVPVTMAIQLEQELVARLDRMGGAL